MSKDFYKVLGIEANVSSAEIKRAYRKLVKKCHPDVGHKGKSADQRFDDNEYMLSLNEAYETLMDEDKRAAYDRSLRNAARSMRMAMVVNALNEDEERERYLRKVFHPCRQAIYRLLNKYQSKLRELSLDIYDDELIAHFAEYIDKIESALRHGSDTFTREPCPPSLAPALGMMRYAIAQAADGLEETRRFCENFDYDHLVMAGNLFRIAQDLSRQSLRLTR